MDLSGYSVVQEQDETLRERGLRLLSQGIAQLWEGLNRAEKKSVKALLRRTHAALGWPSNPGREPPPYTGPEDVPVEDSYRAIDVYGGFVTRPLVLSDIHEIEVCGTLAGLLRRIAGARRGLTHMANACRRGIPCPADRAEESRVRVSIHKRELDAFLLPRLEPLWMNANLLKVSRLPPWQGEPADSPSAVDALDRLAAAIRAEQARREDKCDQGPKVQEPALVGAEGYQGKRGRKPATDQAADTALAEDWARAKERGVSKKQFAKDKRLTRRELDRVLGRVRIRKQRAQ
jgi:hypothetical protein